MKSNHVINFICLGAIILLMGCKDDNDPPEHIPGLCVLLTDTHALPYGTIGDCEFLDVLKQWQNVELTPEQAALLDFPDTMQVYDTIVPVIDQISAYPNPNFGTGDMTFQFTSFSAPPGIRVKLKLAITDENDVVLATRVMMMYATGGTAFSAEGFGLEKGKVYRMYYQVFGGTQLMLIYQGYGNFFTCDAEEINDVVKDCF